MSTALVAWLSAGLKEYSDTRIRESGPTVILEPSLKVITALDAASVINVSETRIGSFSTGVRVPDSPSSRTVFSRNVIRPA
ncbi:MAG: hypothetical protein HW380_3183 [Magnetococcales bacterium]|nr:hypothetical protein [Magnetococcales bacterium]